MTAAASSTNGNLFKVAISSTQTTIVRRSEVDGPKRGRNKQETSDLDSASETSLPGILRGKPMKLKIWIDPNGTTDAFLEASLEAGRTETWSYGLSNSSNSTYVGMGWIMDYELGTAKLDQLQSAEITIQPTGVWALTP